MAEGRAEDEVALAEAVVALGEVALVDVAVVGRLEVVAAEGRGEVASRKRKDSSSY